MSDHTVPDIDRAADAIRRAIWAPDDRLTPWDQLTEDWRKKYRTAVYAAMPYLT